MSKLPNIKTPCKDCPFRKDTQKGWLGKERIEEILNQKSFVCHKTVDYKNGDMNGRLQCAGHMHMLDGKNEFVALARMLNIDTGLTGRELVFNNPKDCIKHHSHD